MYCKRLFDGFVPGYPLSCLSSDERTWCGKGGPFQSRKKSTEWIEGPEKVSGRFAFGAWSMMEGEKTRHVLDGMKVPRPMTVYVVRRMVASRFPLKCMDSVEFDMTDDQLEVFMDQWRLYKQGPGAYDARITHGLIVPLIKGPLEKWGMGLDCMESQMRGVLFMCCMGSREDQKDVIMNRRDWGEGA